MRKWISMLAIALATVSFTACSDDDDASNDNVITVSPQTTRSILQSGTWKIDYYKIGDVDQTSNYNTMELDFLGLGVLSVREGDAAYTGLWEVSNSTEITPGTSLNAPEIDLMISGSTLVNTLDNDWDITAINENQVHLRDDDNGTTYVLHLERIE